jgi:Protein of unknown function (DUF4230)
MTIQPTNSSSQDPTLSTTAPIDAETDSTVVYVREPTGSRWSRRLLMLVGTIGVIVALVFGLKAVNLWPTIRNPFATQQTDKSGPVLLQSIQDLSRYVAAEGNFQVLVDLQENKKFIPDIIFNQRTLFVGVGSVEAYVDFSALGAGAITVSSDGKSVDVKLPEPQLGKPSLDTDKSYVFAEDKGIVNRIGDLVGGDPNKQQQLYKLANDKIAAAANDSELRDRAKKNTSAMLESLLKGLGYERVTITYTAS